MGGVTLSETHKQKLSEILAYTLATLLVLVGVALLATAIVDQLRNDYAPVTTFTELPSIIAIILAAFVLLISIVGVISLIRNYIGGIKFFVIAAGFILAAEYIVGIMCFCYSEMAADYVEQNLNFGVISYGLPGYEKLTDSIDRLQADFKCCGYEDFRDWESHSTNFTCLDEDHIGFIAPISHLSGVTNTSMCSTPPSCCGFDKAKNSSVCGYWRFTINESWGNISRSPQVHYEGYPYTTGCGQTFKYWIMDKMAFGGLICLTMTIPQLLCLVGVVWLVSYLGDQRVMYKSTYYFYD